VTARLLHLSDLHTGAREEREVQDALVRFVERTQPQLVVASGDLAHRGRRADLERADALLRSLGPPVLAVPGNHDLPPVPARFLRPWVEFERIWETTEPVVTLPGLQVAGFNSVRPFRYQGGALSDAQLELAAARLGATEPGALRVAVLHHHLLGAPWRAPHKRPISRRSRVLAALLGAGANLILAGHIHQAAVSERQEFEVVGDEGRTAVVAVAPGLGRPRPRRLGEARGLLLHEADADAIVVRTFVWKRGDWTLVAERAFPR
jgi:3',5'-cyclic AMP phosphodiesterase CpdA